MQINKGYPVFYVTDRLVTAPRLKINENDHFLRRMNKPNAQDQSIEHVYIAVNDNEVIRAVHYYKNGQLLASDAEEKYLWQLVYDSVFGWLAILKETTTEASAVSSKSGLKVFPDSEFWTDAMELSANLYSFRFIFGRRGSPGELKTDVAVVMSPTHAKDLVKILHKHIEEFEKRFGEIPAQHNIAENELIVLKDPSIQ